MAVFQDPSGRAPSRRSLIVRGLNLIVVGVFLSIERLGLAGALTCSTTALACATAAQLLLRRTVISGADADAESL